MRHALIPSLVVAAGVFACQPALAGQAPGTATDPDIPVSHHDRVYAAEQFSNTVSVTDPADNKLLGVIRLGEPSPTNFSPLYKGQVLVHGMGFSPDHHTLAVVSIGSNSVTFIDTATNAVKHVTYVGRAPHEAFFTPDGKEVWVTVRGENYVSVLDGATYQEKTRITTPNGPGMQIFSPDGKYGYVCSSFNPEIDVITVADHAIVGKVTQASPFCPNIAATPDGAQVWFTLKDTGKTQVFDARPPFALLKTLDTGPITNHVNIVRNARGQFAYVTVGGLNQIKVFRTDDFSQVATIAVGNLPHGIWPSGDGSRVYVGLENDDKVTAIDTMTNTVIATSPIGQAPQALVYVPNAVPVASDANNTAMTMMPGDTVPEATAIKGLQPLGVAGQAANSYDDAGRQWHGSRRQDTNQCDAVRPGTDSSAGGGRQRASAWTSLCARIVEPAGRRRKARGSRQLHDQSGRSGDRQCDWSDPSDRAKRSQGATPLSGDSAWHCRRSGRSGSDPAGRMRGMGLSATHLDDPETSARLVRHIGIHVDIDHADAALRRAMRSVAIPGAIPRLRTLDL